MHTRVRLLLALFLVGALTATWLGSGRAASHREAPLMALDPAADITDVYAFVSYDDANMAEATQAPYGRKTQREPAVKEVHILWTPDGMSSTRPRMPPSSRANVRPHSHGPVASRTRSPVR